MKEDGRTVTPRVQSGKEDPISIGIALDTSSSMQVAMTGGDRLRERIRQPFLGAADQTFVTAFDEEPRLIQPLTNNRKEVTASIYSVHATAVPPSGMPCSTRSSSSTTSPESARCRLHRRRQQRRFRHAEGSAAVRTRSRCAGVRGRDLHRCPSTPGRSTSKTMEAPGRSDGSGGNIENLAASTGGVSFVLSGRRIFPTSFRRSATTRAASTC